MYFTKSTKIYLMPFSSSVQLYHKPKLILQVFLARTCDVSIKMKNKVLFELWYFWKYDKWGLPRLVLWLHFKNE